MPACVCCLKMRQDPYWTKMCKIMRLQYIVLAGVLLPLILIGSFGYLIPGFVYCKDYQAEPSYLDTRGTSIQRITVRDGITTTIYSDSANVLDQFKVDFDLRGGDLTLLPSARAYPCSNAVLNVSLSADQSLEVSADNTSPLRLTLENQTLDQLVYEVSHFSGQLTVNGSALQGASIVTPSDVRFQASSVAGALRLSGPGSIALVNCTAPEQSVVAGGEYRYVQLSAEPVRSIAVDTSAQNTRHRPQMVCLTADSFRGCATLQNKYWLGEVGVRLYDENGTLAAEVAKNSHSADTELRELANTGETVKVCYRTEDEEPGPAITMQNRGDTVLVLYKGSAPPSECYE